VRLLRPFFSRFGTGVGTLNNSDFSGKMEDLQSRDWSNDQRKLEFRHVSNKKKLGIELWGGRQHVKAQPIWDTQLG
jgi:hypothetical protein